MGDGESNAEWSKPRSSPDMHVTSPRGKFDPYLPALPAWIYTFRWSEDNAWCTIKYTGHITPNLHIIINSI